jgi:hypothetical protein
MLERPEDNLRQCKSNFCNIKIPSLTFFNKLWLPQTDPTIGLGPERPNGAHPLLVVRLKGKGELERREVVPVEIHPAGCAPYHDHDHGLHGHALDRDNQRSRETRFDWAGSLGYWPWPRIRTEGVEESAK